MREERSGEGKFLKIALYSFILLVYDENIMKA